MHSFSQEYHAIQSLPLFTSSIISFTKIALVDLDKRIFLSIVETWLDGNVHDSELYVEGYDFFSEGTGVLQVGEFLFIIKQT